MIAASRQRIHAIVVAISIALLAPAAPARDRELPDHFDLGRDSEGDPCAATRSWSVGAGGIRVAAIQPFIVTCRGSTAARGYVDMPSGKPAAAADGAQPCGDPRRVPVPGSGPAEARLCHDARLGLNTVDLRLAGFHGAAAPGAIAPLLVLLRSAAADRAVAPPAAGAPQIDVTALPAPPPLKMAGEAAAADQGIDPDSALRQGLALIHAGRYVEASRLLNDAVAQFAEAAPLQRVELRLNAALADSNTSKFEAADQAFQEADALLGPLPSSEAKSSLATEAATYRALDLINRNRFADAIRALDAAAPAQSPLLDPATLAAINQGGSGLPKSVHLGVDSQTQALAVRVQQASARSQAYLGLGKIAESQAALAAAVSYATLLEKATSVNAMNWLRASLQRQQGRIQYRNGQVDAAVNSFDCAITMMHGAPLPVGKGCLFAASAQDGPITPLSGPVIAEAQLERTSMLATLPGADHAALERDYEAAVATLAEAPGVTGTVSPLLGNYLDLLVADAGTSPTPETAERFFRALQIVREPGIAREYATLQAVVSGGKAGARLRDREELERRQIQLRYQIAALPANDPGLPALEAQRRETAAALEVAKADLAGMKSYSAVDDEPVTVAELRGALRPGEAYLKLVEVGQRVYGAVITPGGSSIYGARSSAAEIGTLADAVLASARPFRGLDGRNRIHPFRVDSAYALFKAVSGPAPGRLSHARALVVDTADALRGVPAAILVTEPAPAGLSSPKAGADYSRVAFLGSRVEMASALSPRSFMQVRMKLPPSNAPKPLIGFGENALAPAPSSAAVGAQRVMLGAACSVSYGSWAGMFNGNIPISAAEMHVAAAELGAPDAPIVTGSAFTTAAIMKDSADGTLAQYQVIHFATHGIPSEPLSDGSCETPLPPSLITSLLPPGADGETPSNGLLSYVDVARLSLDANLVVLSACETASGVTTSEGRLAGQEESAPTLDGLVRAFIVAQARAVLATYWQVQAQVGTEDLIAAFYKSGRREPMGAALHQAQLTVLRQPATSHPYFWAAFFLVGDGAKTMLSGATARAQTASR